MRMTDRCDDNKLNNSIATADTTSTTRRSAMKEGRREARNLRRLAVGLLAVLSSPQEVSCFSSLQPMPRTTKRHNGGRERIASTTRLHVSQSVNNDDRAGATPLELTMEDFSRLYDMQKRHTVMPIMILDAMLPKQQLTLESPDPKFRKLYEYALENSSSESGTAEIGMLGLNPHTGRPLSRGVTVEVRQERTTSSNGLRLLATATDRRFEIQGEPWVEYETNLASVEMIHNRSEEMSSQQLEMALQLAQTLPQLMKQWMEAVVEADITDQDGMRSRIDTLGPIPSFSGATASTTIQSTLTDQAFWVAAALNPLPAWSRDVCVEIRPAMLACTNPYDRMVLAVQAVQSSIDHVTGKRKLF